MGNKVTEKFLELVETHLRVIGNLPKNHGCQLVKEIKNLRAANKLLADTLAAVFAWQHLPCRELMKKILTAVEEKKADV